MKVSDINGQFISLATTLISLVLAGLTAFHVLSLTSMENTSIMVVATAAIGLGLYVYSILHSWATASFDLSRVTTLLTALAAALMALLDAFGVFRFDQSQQAAVLGVAGGIAFLGGFVFSYLHTAKQVHLLALQIAAQRTAQQAQRSR